MLTLAYLIWNAVLGPWHRGFLAMVAAAIILAFAAPLLGWSSGAGPAVAFVVVVAAASVAGMMPGVVGSRVINRGAALSRAGKYQEAIDLFDSYPRRFGSDRLHPERVALAMVWKGTTLAASGRHSDALAAYDSVLAQFPDTRDSRAEVRMARVLVLKARVLSALSRTEEAAAVYDDVVARFSDSRVSAVRKYVAAAQAERGAIGGVAAAE